MYVCMYVCLSVCIYVLLLLLFIIIAFFAPKNENEWTKSPFTKSDFEALAVVATYIPSLGEPQRRRNAHNPA